MRVASSERCCYDVVCLLRLTEDSGHSKARTVIKDISGYTNCSGSSLSCIFAHGPYIFTVRVYSVYVRYSCIFVFRVCSLFMYVRGSCLFDVGIYVRCSCIFAVRVYTLLV